MTQAFHRDDDHRPEEEGTTKKLRFRCSSRLEFCSLEKCPPPSLPVVSYQIANIELVLSVYMFGGRSGEVGCFWARNSHFCAAT